MAENKTKPTSASVEAFIAGIDNPVRQADTWTAVGLYKKITGLPPVMWGPSIIGFGSRDVVYKSGRKGKMPLACFAPRKANMTFYVSHKPSGARDLYSQLGKHKKSVACLYITKLSDVDLHILEEIIRCEFKRISGNGAANREYIERVFDELEDWELQLKHSDINFPSDVEEPKP